MQIIKEAVNERSTKQLRVPFYDQAAAPLDPSVVQSLTATLHDVKTGGIVAGRQNQNVLNVNGGTFAAGVLTLQLTEADTASLSDHNLQERILTLDLVANGGARVTEEVMFVVRAMERIT